VSGQAEPSKTLVLHVAVPGFWADDLDESAAVLSQPEEPSAEDRLYIVTEEWMRREVGITLVSLPGEKNLNSEFEVHAYTGRIVGADVIDRDLRL
jgi:hypothetical protein